jgi:hypothetical protein
MRLFFGGLLLFVTFKLNVKKQKEKTIKHCIKQSTIWKDEKCVCFVMSE